jgi:putative drug exporter of the RND superfamily
MASTNGATRVSVFARLGRGVYRRRKLVIALWGVGLVLGILAGGQVFGKLQDGLSRSSNSESERAYRLLDRTWHPSGPSIDVGAFVTGSPSDPAVRAGVRSAIVDIQRIPGVAGVQFAPAADHAGVAIGVDIAGHSGPGPEAALAHAEARLRVIRPGPVFLGSGDLVDQQMNDSAKHDLARAELIGLPLVLLIMLLIFRSLRVAVIPLVVALVSIAGSLLVLLVFASVTSVSVFAVNVVTMLGLGLAVDYSLLAISRFREERGRGLDVPSAVERTVGTAGRTMLFSGATVAICLAGMLFLQGGFRSVAYGGMGVVVVGLLAGLTLIPALLGVWGARVRPSNGVTDHGVFYRLSRIVQKRALVIVPVAAAVLLVFAAPFLQAHYQDSDYRYLPPGSGVREFYSAMAAHFPEQTIDPIMVVGTKGAPAWQYVSYEEQLRMLPGVRSVTPETGTSDRVRVLDVLSNSPAESQPSFRLVNVIRSMDPPFQTLVAGKSAEFVDERAGLISRIPYVVVFIVLATFVLLFLMTGSVVVPAKALVMNVLSLSASFGALVWVFQDGHLSGPLGFTPTGSVDLVVPVLIFVFAFGLSMDYEVFLLSRIRESYQRTGDNDHAVAAGLQRSGRVVTTAALLMTVVFAGFAAGSQLTVKQVGLGLVLAVVIDATIIRMLLVPATMKLMGRWNWWAPRPLRRLHERFGIREEAREESPAVAPAATTRVPALVD